METRSYTASDRDAMVELVQAVAALDGAVGWLTVPAPPEIHVWLDGIGKDLVVAVEDGQVVACGALTRRTPVVLQHMGEVVKVMTHPVRRGLGAGDAVMRALIERAREHDLELLTLDCRGNNHGAQRLYARLGFVVTGRRPDAIAVGDERFDQVLMHLDLRVGTTGLRRHGSRGGGRGSTD